MRIASPVEQLLGALGNCLAVGYAANASVEGIHIRSLHSSGDMLARTVPLSIELALAEN